MTTATIGGRTFNSVTDRVVDADGIAWVLSELPGWRSGGRAEVGGTPLRPRGVALGGQLMGRSLSFRGLAICATEAAMWKAGEKIAETFSGVETDMVLVLNEPTPKQIAVRRDGEIDESKRGLSIAFEVPLIAADPTKYSTTQQSNATLSAVAATIDNGGTARTPPVLEVTGPTTANVEFWNDTTNERITLLPFADAAAAIVDMANKTVTIGGVNRFGLVVLASTTWWELVPGNNSIRRAPATVGGGGATPTIRWRNGYA